MWNWIVFAGFHQNPAVVSTLGVALYLCSAVTRWSNRQMVVDKVTSVFSSYRCGSKTRRKRHEIYVVSKCSNMFQSYTQAVNFEISFKRPHLQTSALFHMLCGHLLKVHSLVLHQLGKSLYIYIYIKTLQVFFCASQAWLCQIKCVIRKFRNWILRINSDSSIKVSSKTEVTTTLVTATAG